MLNNEILRLYRDADDEIKNRALQILRESARPSEFQDQHYCKDPETRSLVEPQ